MNERYIQIIAAASLGFVTRKEIAAALGLKKHPALIAQIEELVHHGQLERKEGTYKNRPCWFYQSTGKTR